MVSCAVCRVDRRSSVNYSLQFTACVPSQVAPVRALDSAVQWTELPLIYQCNEEWSGNPHYSFSPTEMGSLEGKPAKSGQIRKFVGGEFTKNNHLQNLKRFLPFQC